MLASRHGAVTTLILIVSAVVMSYRIATPAWEFGRQGAHAAILRDWARDFLAFGYLDTKLSLLWDLGTGRSPSGFTYRLDYGSLSALSMSFSYLLFGESDWSGRVVYVAATLATAWLVYRIALRLFADRALAIVSLALAAFMPVQLYYGRQPSPYAMGFVCVMIVFHSYLRWAETGARRYCIGIFAGLVGGAASEWLPYLTVPFVGLHYLLWRRPKFSVTFALAWGAAPFALFGAYLIWTYWKAGQSGLAYLWELFLFRSRSVDEFYFSIGDYWRRFYEQANDGYTTVLFWLAVVWTFGTVLQIIHNRRVSWAQSFLLMLLAFWIGTGAFLANYLYIHDFIMLGHLVPYVAIAAASVLVSSVRALRHLHIGYAVAFVVVVGVLAIQQAVSYLEYMHGYFSSPSEFARYEAATIVNATVPSESYYLSTSFVGSQHRHDFHSTADRRFVSFSGTNANFEEVLSANRDAAFVMLPDDESTESALRLQLALKHPRTAAAGHSLFDLRRSGSTVFGSAPANSSLRPRFGDLELVGFEIPALIKRAPEPGWVAKYLYGNPQFLPQYQTEFSVVTYWRRARGSTRDHKIEFAFSDAFDETRVFWPAYGSITNLLPARLWPEGVTVRDERRVSVPATFKAGRYGVWAMVRGPAGYLQANNAPAEAIRFNHRVLLGTIDIQPPTSDSESPIWSKDAKAKATAVGPLVLLGQHREGNWVTTFWTRNDNADSPEYALSLRLSGPGRTIERPVDIVSPRTWKAGSVHVGRTWLPDAIPEGSYQLAAHARSDRGTGWSSPVEPFLWCTPGVGGDLLYERGTADGRPDPSLPIPSESNPLRIEFAAAEKLPLKVRAGWTGQTAFPESRVMVSARNSVWVQIGVRYLDTLRIFQNRPQISETRVPAAFLVKGPNTIEFSLPKRLLVGWRGVFARFFPDLEPILADTRIPYSNTFAGPERNAFAEMDFVQIETAAPVCARSDLGKISSFPFDQLIGCARSLQRQALCDNRPLTATSAGALDAEVAKRVSEMSAADLDATIQSASAATAPPIVISALRSHLEKNFVSYSVGAVITDNAGFPLLRVLGLTFTPVDGATQDVRVYFETLAPIPYDLWMYLHATPAEQTQLPAERQAYGFVNWDQRINPGTSTWEQGRFKVHTQRISAVPGTYLLDIGMYESAAAPRVRFEGTDSPIRPVGEIQLVRSSAAP